ncbi:MAG TPA: glutathione-disulfide reductase [Alphaproteobacteria bacterium]|nr:glutathione-disulfide reductase [Alphaproteobacteria bacterium]
MPTHDYDLYVIGAGSGGVRAARIAAGHGAKVGIAEADRVGGTCVIRGCIPKKLMAYAGHYSGDFEDAVTFGWTVEARFDWATLIANKDREIDRLNGLYIKGLNAAGAELHQVRARLIDAHRIELHDGRTVRAKYILIATGARPSLPSLPGIEHAISSDEIFHLPALPRRVAIVGAGYIALEFASIFRGCGSDVTVIHRGPEPLRGFDRDIRVTIAEEVAARGVQLRFNHEVASIEKRQEGLQVALKQGGGLAVDVVVFATGRHPNTEGLGLEQAGIALGPAGAVPVDAWSRSSVAHIYAIGDVTDRVALTPVAIREGHAFADTVFGRTPWCVDYEAIPTAVFSNPPIGTIGLSEEDARARGPVDIYRSRFRPLRHTLSGRNERTMMKLVVDRTNGRVLGVHMVGEDAPEIVQALAVAVKMGATKADFDATMALHPTAGEEFLTMREKVVEIGA